MYVLPPGHDSRDPGSQGPAGRLDTDTRTDVGGFPSGPQRPTATWNPTITVLNGSRTIHIVNSIQSSYSRVGQEHVTGNSGSSFTLSSLA